MTDMTAHRPSPAGSPADTVLVFGLAACDSVKQALSVLAQGAAPHRLHDFKRQGLSPALLDAWLRQIGPQGWPALVNRQGTTWRKLSPDAQAQAQALEGARGLLLSQPSLVKRPVVQWPDGALTVGLPAFQAAWAARPGR